jgi:hypothetical protein
MMEPPIAALLGATVGGLAGLAGPLVGGSLQAARDKAKWRLDNQRDAYVGTLQHLSTALNMRPAQGDAPDFLAEVTRAQASLAMALVFCSDSQRANLTEAIESLAHFVNGETSGDTSGSPRGSFAELTKIYAGIVACARRDFHHR